MHRLSTEEAALFFGVTIHKEWHDSRLVEVIYRDIKLYCLQEELDYSVFIKRIGDYMRECFDREPKTRDVPLEQATADLQKFVDYWKHEM